MLAQAIVLADTYRQMGIERSVFNGRQPVLPGLEELEIRQPSLNGNGNHPEIESAKKEADFENLCTRIADNIIAGTTVYPKRVLEAALEKGHNPMEVIDRVAALAQENLKAAEEALGRLGDMAVAVAIEMGLPQVQPQPEAVRERVPEAAEA